MVDYEVDYSDVIGRKVACPDGCGMCCLCQPEVLPEERLFFRENHPSKMVMSKGPEPYLALAMKKGKGSCVFLSEGNRRCSIYDHRTAYCRQYPYHIYVGESVKVELDLSCRGVWMNEGNDALSEAKDVVSRADRRIRSALCESTEVYRRFYANCEEAGVMGDHAAIRASLSDNLDKFVDLGYLSAIMEASQMEPVMKLEGLQMDVKPEIPELELAARDSALESMATKDPMNAPVYCDPEWNWNIFMAKGDVMTWNVMNDSGDLDVMGKASVEDISLKPLEAEGKEVLMDYIRVLNGRDSFLGSVFSLMDYNGYEDDMTNAYYGCMSTTLLDLMWRASMLDHFTGCGMGAEGIREAIIFYDMDRLDAPAIGAFV